MFCSSVSRGRQIFEVCTVDRQTLERAEALPGDDFADNLQIVCADIAGLDAIVTRNKADFQAATIPIFAPPELLVQLSSANP